MPTSLVIPKWLELARKEIGTREGPDNTGPAIARYISLAHAGAQHDPWCAIFLNAMLEQAGVHGTRSPSSQSFRHDPHFVLLSGPALGAIVVYWRISKSSGLGHVGFYVGEDAHGFINTLGGNESDMVREELLNPRGSNFGLVGYYWPQSIPLPSIGKITVANAQWGNGSVV